MKKFIIILSVIAIVTTSCKKVTEQYYTTPNKTIFASINSWSTADGGFTYTATVNMPEINAAAYDLDATLVYGTFEDGEDEPIPQVFNGIAYNYAVRVGSITIKVQSSDYTKINPPSALPIKIVLIASQE